MIARPLPPGSMVLDGFVRLCHKVAIQAICLRVLVLIHILMWYGQPHLVSVDLYHKT